MNNLVGKRRSVEEAAGNELFFSARLCCAGTVDLSLRFVPSIKRVTGILCFTVSGYTGKINRSPL
jgi:hypothetical protein